MPAGAHRVRFDFSIDGNRFRPTLPWIPNETNLRRARIYLTRIKAQIEAGTFCFADEFPRYRGLQRLPPSLQSRSCGEVFDEFLRHEESRLARGDLAAVTVASHRKILNHVWRPHLETMPFLGIRYSMLLDRRCLHLQQENLQQCDQCPASGVQLWIPRLSRARRSSRRAQMRANRQEGPAGN